MKHSESIKSISKALCEAQKELGTIGMTGFNAFDKYKYAKFEDYVKQSKPILTKHGLAVMFSCDDVKALDNRLTQKGGTEYVARATLTCTLIHGESGEWISIQSVGDGQDRGDKGLYKANTGARKYGIAGLLCLATGDDAEDEDAPPPPAQRPVAKPSQVSTAKQQVLQAVAKWSGVAKEDLPRAVSDVVRKSGVKIAGANATDAELEQIHKWIVNNINKDFAEAMA